MSSKTLKVVEVKPLTDRHHPPMKHSVLPQHEFGLLIVAPPGSGKTNLICNLLLNHFKGYFHDILICSPTVKNDPKWERVFATKGILCENKKLKKILGEGMTKGARKVPKIVHKSQGGENEFKEEASEDHKFDGKIPLENVFDDLDEIPKRLAKQTETLERLEKLGYDSSEAKFLLNRVLLIEDDMAGLYRGSNKQDPLTNVVFKRRHYGCSMIKVSQQFNAIPAGQRNAMGALIIFEIPNINELTTIYESYQMGLNRDDWLEVYKYCTKGKHNFMYYNTGFPKGERIFRNFEEQVKLEDSHESDDTPTNPDETHKDPVPKDQSLHHEGKRKDPTS